MKVKNNNNKRGISKNADCRASILVQIKKNTKNVRYKDPYATVSNYRDNYYCNKIVISLFLYPIKLTFFLIYSRKEYKIIKAFLYKVNVY